MVHNIYNQYINIMRYLITFLQLALVILTSINVYGQDRDTIPVDHRVKTGTLSNGLTYYIRYNNWPENRACFYLAQKVGSFQEEDNQRGLAHFLEHMCFQGSEHFKGNGIKNFCERQGVDFGGGVNAYTSIENTVYNIDNVQTSIGQEKLDSFLLILYDWANGLTLDSLEIEKERGVIHEEWRMGRNATERILERQLPILYSNSKYGHRMPIGLMSIVDSFNHRELKDYYEKWYNPENQCIVVVGDIDVEHTEAQIRKLFGGIMPSANAGKVEAVEVEDHKGIIYSIDKDAELQDNWVRLYFKHNAYTSEDRKRTWHLRNSYITNAAVYMLSTRYNDEALKEGCPFISATAEDEDYWYSSTKSAFTLSAACKDGMQEEALSQMVAICRQAARFGFTEEEYDRYKEASLALMDNFLMKADKTESTSLVEEYYMNYLYGTDMSSAEDYVSINKQIINSTPLDSINKRMKELLPDADDNMVLLCWNVEKEGNRYPTEESLHEALIQGRTAELSPYVNEMKDAKLLSEEPSPGKICSMTENEEIDYKKLTLSNGATVLIKHTDIEKSQVLFKAYGNAGWTMYGEEDDINRKLFNSITFGNNGYSISQIRKIMSGKLVDLTHTIWQSTFTFTGSFNPKDTETFMQLLHAEFTNQTKDENVFRNIIEDTAISLKNRKTVPESAFADSIYVVTLGHHPRFKLLKPEDLEKVSLDRELEIFKEQTSDPSKFTFLFVGNFDEDVLKSFIEKYIASLPVRKEITRGAFIKTWLQEDAYCHFKREMETPKSIVEMDWLSESFPYTLENLIKFDIANRILNMVYSKIVREENSAAYDCSSSYHFSRGGPNEVLCSIECLCSMNPDKTSDVLNLMRSEFERLSTQIDDEMFRNAKESMHKKREELVATKNGFWLDAIWHNERHGLDIYCPYTELLDKTTKEDVMEAMIAFQRSSHKMEVLMTPQ